MSDDGLFVIYSGREFDALSDAADQIVRELSALPDRAAQNIKKDLYALLQQVAKALADRHSAPWNANSLGGQNLHRRSGRGIQSIYDSIAVKGRTLDGLEGRISTRIKRSPTRAELHSAHRGQRMMHTR